MRPVDLKTPDGPGSYRFLIEAILFLSYLVFGISWIGYSPFLKELQARYALNHAQAGMLISAVSFAKIFVPFAAGWMAARMGIRRAVLCGMICICASLFSPFASGYRQLLLSRFVFGMGGAMVVTLLGPVVMQWFPPRERPVVNGFNYVAVNSGISFSLFVTIPLAERFGRSETLAGYAGVSLLLMLMWWIFGRERVPAGTAASSRESYAQVLQMKETWLLTLAFAGPLALYLVFNTWLPTFYGANFGMTRAQASQLTGLANIVGIPAAILGGILSQRMGVRKPFVWGAGLALGVSAFGMFAARSHPLLVTCAVIYGISNFLWISPLTTTAMELPGMTVEKLGMVMGVFYGACYVAAFFAPVVVGALRDATGSFLPGFALFALLSWTLAIAGALLPETGHRPAS